MAHAMLRRRNFLAATAASAAALGLGGSRRARASAGDPAERKLLFVVCAAGGANIIDGFLPVVDQEVGDASLAAGGEAKLEEGLPKHVQSAAGTRIAPEGATVRNPVQDLTPASLVTAIVTERGTLRPPFEASIGPIVAAAPADTVRGRALPPPLHATATYDPASP